MVPPADSEAPQIRTWRVAEAEQGRTLAACLRTWLGGASWGEVRRLVARRHLLVNGNLCTDAARRLRAGDVIKLLPHPTAPLPTASDIRIRYLDDHVVVVEKPAGMTSVRHAEERHWPAHRKRQNPTLQELLPRAIVRSALARGAGLAGRGGSRGEARRGAGAQRAGRRPVHVYAVHRLDRDTSGLLVFARTAAAQHGLVEQFRRHTATRRYLAVVQGRVRSQTISTRLVRDRGDGRRGSTAHPTQGKLAVTHVRPLEYLGPYTLVECRLETGRTHQIRIHLAEAGHPVCGEKIYHKPLHGPPQPDLSHAPRLALHAAELAFVHPISGKPLVFEAPLPDELRQFVDRLRRSAANTHG
jgi:23S rRNA pseudouridine1911/1915/1917 synthase